MHHTIALVTRILITLTAASFTITYPSFAEAIQTNKSISQQKQQNVNNPIVTISPPLVLSNRAEAIQMNEQTQKQTNSINSHIITISPQLALPIGIKIWFNECGGSVMGLTTWNHGEDFASLGIGHFVWHPYQNNRASFNSGFPRLLKYMKTRGVDIPTWLDGRRGLYCPWSNRNEFLKEQYSQKMVQLRAFLQKTIPIQAEYMARHLQEILPELLASSPVSERPFVYGKFKTLARTSTGIYAMVDYLNFKGPGITGCPHNYNNYRNGSGLLQVLGGMKHAPRNLTPIQAYVWSAKHALIRRVERSSSQHHERWLAGWFKRLNTYLET